MKNSPKRRRCELLTSIDNSDEHCSYSDIKATKVIDDKTLCVMEIEYEPTFGKCVVYRRGQTCVNGCRHLYLIYRHINFLRPCHIKTSYSTVCDHPCVIVYYTLYTACTVRLKCYDAETLVRTRDGCYTVFVF